jgi:drug/metabolite transporter (DMT)-like permease
MLLFGAAVIGTVPILVRLTETGPAAAGFWRLLLALPVLFLMARPGLGGARGRGPVTPILALAGLMFALDMAFWHYGLHLTTVANATVLTNLTPVVVTAVAWIVFRERPAGLFLAAVAMAVAGATLMSLARSGAAGGVNPPANQPLGDLLSLATALWYAFYLLSVGRARRTLGPAQVMFGSTLVGVPILLVVALGFREQIVPVVAAGWLACLGLAAAHVAGQGSIAWALGRLPTATASMVVLVQPVVAAILGWALLHESLSPWQAVGGAVALIGVVLSQWASARQSRQALDVPPTPA